MAKSKEYTDFVKDVLGKGITNFFKKNSVVEFMQSSQTVPHWSKLVFILYKK